MQRCRRDLHWKLTHSRVEATMEESDMTRPQTPFEAASYDLKKFRERRIADRRFMPRASADRRGANPTQVQPPDAALDGSDGD
jgi:hypothetical protein